VDKGLGRGARSEKHATAVCLPINLGQRPSNEAPTYRYEYVPLDMVADEIRMLVLMPAEDPSAPLVMRMAHCPMHCEVNYHALSYTWGDPQPLSKVIIMD
jgi:hypothetical protein